MVKALLKQTNRRTYAGFRNYVLIFLLLDTEMRIGEFLGLRVDAIDLMGNIISLKAHETKGKRARQIPFSQKTNRLIRQLLVDIEDFNSEYLFLTVYGDRLGQQRFRNRLKEYGENAEIEGVRVSPHTCRHTFSKNIEKWYTYK